MHEQLRQEAADRDGMLTKEDKAQEKAADIERMKRNRGGESRKQKASSLQGMTPATGFPCPRLPSPGDRRHPIDHSVPFDDPKRVTKEGV
jgi:hypothetical protein